MKIDMPYGRTKMVLDIPDEQVIAVVKANNVDLPTMTSAEAVREGLKHPVASPPLKDIVKAGEKVCVVVPDITRTWQSPQISVPIVLDELEACGIKPEDITILCACGTHAAMTPEAHEQLLGQETVKKYRVVDHQCREKEQMRHVGVTSRGTSVDFNRIAVEADRIISICGVVYHFIAGFGGGGKMILPGIAAWDTIQHSHKLALNEGFGSGRNPEVRSRNISDSNPFHADIVEAASMLPPDFTVNVVVDDDYNIRKAFTGNWKEAHLEACRLMDAMDGVAIPRKAPLVIASAGGMPKDINYFQGIKLMSNALAALEPGGTMILLLECPQGMGNANCERIIKNHTDLVSREKSLREDFSIGAYAAYFSVETAQNHNVILVTDMPPEEFANTHIKVVRSLEEALSVAAKLNGGKSDLPCVVMPHGATTLPIVEGEA